MRLTKSHSSEFDLYESIILGSLNAFLTPESSSNEFIKNLVELQKKYILEGEDYNAKKLGLCTHYENECHIDITWDPESVSKIQEREQSIPPQEFPTDNDELDLEDIEMLLEPDQEKLLEINQQLVDRNFDDFDDLKIPQPPDEKAEYFLSLIENEFEEIQKRAKKLLRNVQKEKLISSFANKNIQKAKKLAMESGNLSRDIIEYSEVGIPNESEAYIVNVLAIKNWDRYFILDNYCCIM